ncbi:hypothetical protein ACYF6T_23900 [Streptomyces sp. 7R007]
MDAELAALVGTGATTVVGLMVTDAWEQTKQRLVRILARTGRADTVGEDLDESRAALAAAAGTPDEPHVTADVTATLRLRLRRLLEQHPDAADDLRHLVEDLAGSGPVVNTISGGTQYGPVFQGHSFSNLTFRGPAGRRDPENG